MNEDATPELPDQPAFSRRGITGDGKLDVTLKTQVSEGTATLFQAMAVEAGCSTSELLRDLVYLKVHQRLHSEIAAAKIRKVLGEPGPE